MDIIPEDKSDKDNALQSLFDSLLKKVQPLAKDPLASEPIRLYHNLEGEVDAYSIKLEEDKNLILFINKEAKEKRSRQWFDLEIIKTWDIPAYIETISKKGPQIFQPTQEDFKTASDIILDIIRLTPKTSLTKPPLI